MRQSFDPLTFIPSSGAIRKNLTNAEGLVKRLRVLLRVAERIEATREHEPDAVEKSPLQRARFEQESEAADER